MKKTILNLLLLLLVAGCGGGQQKKSETSEKPVFVSVEVPLTISDPQAKADFIAAHFWDKFNFRDTSFIAYPEIFEQQLVEYLAVLPYAGPGLANKSLKKLMTDAQADSMMYAYFIDQMEHYLWDPNSPFQNSELYIPVLESMISSKVADQATRVRSVYRLEMAKKNRVGKPANDFNYTLASGKTGKMSQIKSEYLLLFFNNPGCATCSAIIQYTNASPVIQRFLDEKQLTVLAVYPDEELEEWRKYLSSMPEDWLNGYDKDLVITELYDLKAIPSLYLLDKDKTVILKDAHIEQIEEYLQQRD